MKETNPKVLTLIIVKIQAGDNFLYNQTKSVILHSIKKDDQSLVSNYRHRYLYCRELVKL